VIAQERLQRQLGKTTAKLQALERGRDAAAAEKEKLLNAQKKLQIELGQSRANLLALEKGQKTAGSDKEKLLADKKRLRGELRKSKERLKELEGDKAAVEGEKGRLLTARQVLQEELGKSKARLLELAEGKAAAEGETEKLLADQQKLLERLGKSKAALQALEKDKAAAEGETEKLLADQQKLQQALDQSRAKLKETAEGKNAAEADKEKLLADQIELQKKLDDIQAKEQLRNNIISRLKENFDRHGISADIDEGTGEVTLPFNEAYFDFDSDALKPKMKQYLKKIIPVYTKSIFSESDVTKYIKSIEVVGSASPIYLGKYVNPHSLSSKARAALNYNMDLSYRRARSIFKYILNKRNIKYDHQADLMVYLKVTGRSYLTAAPMKELPPEGIDMKEFCSKYDCEKLQSAVIRFNLVD
jgi:outer membrane protein OmpA-like peptidoglycan-associated protein